MQQTYDDIFDVKFLLDNNFSPVLRMIEFGYCSPSGDPTPERLFFESGDAFWAAQKAWAALEPSKGRIKLFAEPVGNRFAPPHKRISFSQEAT